MNLSVYDLRGHFAQSPAFIGLAFVSLPARNHDLERVYELTDAEPDRPEGDEGVVLQNRGGPEFRFEGLSYAYPDAPESPVLKDLTCVLPSGSVIGLFGKTGSARPRSCA